MKQTLLAIVWLCWPCVAWAAETPDAQAGGSLTFEADIRPILKAHCFLCHGEEETEGKLDLRMARLILAGGDSGPGVVPHKPDESFLVERIESGEMPPGKKKLTSRDVALIRRWIKEGAKTARPEPETVEQAEFTAEERTFCRPAITAAIERVV